MSRMLTALLLALALVPTAALAGEVKVHILDATVKDKVIAGVEVILQKNGETSVTAKTDAKGDVAFANPFQGADDKSVTLIAKKEGYSNLVTVKASSYFNIASVYEEQGEWQRALDAYQAALSFKDNDVYKRGIERMQGKLGQ